MACWRRLITLLPHSIHQAPTQVQRRQSELGKVKHLFTRNYGSQNKKSISNSAREEESSIGGLKAALRNAGKPIRDRFFGTKCALIRMLPASKGGNFKEMPLFLFFWGSQALLFLYAGYIVLDKYGEAIGIFEEVQPSIETSTRFRDVKGVDEAKAELEEIVHYLKDPTHFTRLGGKLPKSVLLVGPPGAGKALLARAIAEEAGVPIFASSGRELEEMFIGLGAKRVRDIFAAAKKRSPCIIFIDEIDAIGGNGEMYIFRMTLNQMLVELDGCKQNEGIIVIAATDNPDSLDKAFVRPGPFDRHIIVPNPDVEGRRQILEYHMSKYLKEEDVDVMIFARRTLGFSGADLAALVDAAAQRAAMYGAKAVRMQDLEFAQDMSILGGERKSTFISDESRKIAASREGGHALVAIHTVGALPFHKATIVPRGMTLDTVSKLLDNDENGDSLRKMLGRLDVCMGGLAAEDLIFGEYDTERSSDFLQAFALAMEMVMKYGLDTEVGHIRPDSRIFFSSSETKQLLLNEVTELVERAYTNAYTVLTTHKKELNALANALLEHETLTGSQINDILANDKSQQQQPWSGAVEVGSQHPTKNK